MFGISNSNEQFTFSVCKYKALEEGKFFDNFFVEIFSSIQFRISAFKQQHWHDCG